MHTPGKPRVTGAPERDVGAAWADSGLDARGLAPLSPEAAPPAAIDRSTRWRADIPVAKAVVKHTISLGALAAGLIEYTGWQIANRGGDGSNVVPLKAWALGTIGNLGGAVAIGLGVACIAMVLAASRKRPLRAGAAAFAFGVAGFLSFLAFLVSRAF